MRLFGKKPTEQQLETELRFHMESAIEAKIASGSAPNEARRAVALEFGGTVQIKEECRDVGSAPWIEHLYLDLATAFGP